MHLQERPNNVKNGCSASADDSELNTTPDGQVLQVVFHRAFVLKERRALSDRELLASCYMRVWF